MGVLRRVTPCVLARVLLLNGNGYSYAPPSNPGCMREFANPPDTPSRFSYGLQYVPVGVIWVPDRYLPNQRRIPSMTGDCWLRTVSNLQR